MSEKRIVRRTLQTLRKGKTDWKRLGTLTDEEIERAVADDPDAAPLLDAEWFKDAELVYPDKQMISIRLDADVLKLSAAPARAGRRASIPSSRPM